MYNIKKPFQREFLIFYCNSQTLKYYEQGHNGISLFFIGNHAPSQYNIPNKRSVTVAIAADAYVSNDAICKVINNNVTTCTILLK